MMNVVATLYCIAVYAATISEGTQPLLKGCCEKTSTTQVAVSNLKNYIKQSSPCDIVAIRFTTMKDTIICSSPESRWAQHAMQMIDRGQKMTTITTTTSTTPTSTTTSTTTPISTALTSTTTTSTTTTSTTPSSTTPSSTTPTSTTPSSTTPSSTTPTSTTPSSTTPSSTTPSSTTPTSTTPTSTTPTTKTFTTGTPISISPTTRTIIITNIVLHTRKIRWIKNRRNRWKKPGLRLKQKP